MILSNNLSPKYTLIQTIGLAQSPTLYLVFGLLASIIFVTVWDISAGLEP